MVLLSTHNIMLLSHCVFQNNRQSMTKDAKQAAKLEKKLKILLGGYQVGETDFRIAEIRDFPTILKLGPGAC